MKTNVLACLALCSGLTAQAQWVKQPITFANPASTPVLVEAVDATTVWTATVDVLDANPSYVPAQVARSIDGGQSFAVRSLPLNVAAKELIVSLSAVSGNTAWVLTNFLEGSGNGLLRTTDGGQSWTAQGSGVVFSSPNSTAYHVHFFSATEGLVVGASRTSGGSLEMYRTTDGGESWTAVSAPATLPNEAPIVLPPATVGNSIWLATDEGRVFRSTDRGQTWAVFNVASKELNQMNFRDQQNGLALSLDESGTKHDLFRTADGGQTWSQVNYSGPLHGVSISAVPGTSQYVSVGYNLGNGDQGSSYSRDNGQTWVALENQINHFVVDFISPTVGWSSGFQGTTSNPLGSGLNKFSSTVLGTRDANVALQAGLQVVPNPAEHGRSSLRTAQPFSNSPAQVRVLDVTGRLVSNYSWTGNDPLELDLSREKAGLYVLEVTGKSGTARQKLQVQ